MSNDVPITMFHAEKIRRKEFEEYDSAYSSISAEWMLIWLQNFPDFCKTYKQHAKHLWKRKSNQTEQREQNRAEPRAFLTRGTIHLAAPYLAMPLACSPSDCDAEQHQHHPSSKQ